MSLFMHAMQETMAYERAGQPLQCSAAFILSNGPQGTEKCSATICYICPSSSTETGPNACPWSAGEEDAEDSDEEINEDLDIDAAADAFAAAARQKGYGDGPQHGGGPALHAMLLFLSAGSRMLPAVQPILWYHAAPAGMATVSLSSGEGMCSRQEVVLPVSTVMFAVCQPGTP